jgi:phage terminase large subunit-like protein
VDTGTIAIDLKEPHAKQLAFGISPAKRKVIVAGRRGGKTTGVAMLAVEAMLYDGRRILEAAPTQDQTEAFWETCKDILADLITAGVLYKNESRHVLEMPNGARIRTKTAWDADTLRGDYADLLILDEFADMDPSTWDQVGAPMLLDNDGDAIFIGTPKRKNHFHKQYVKAIGDDTGRWAAWHFTSHDNPYLSEEALAEITADMTADAYQQEILAEFLDNEGAVFRNIEACLYPGGDTPEDHKGHELVMGVDWGKSEDYTVCSVGCRECKREVALDRFHGIPYTLQRQRIHALSDKWGVYDILAESNAMGEPNIEDMQYAGMPVRGFATTASSKPPLIDNLVLCFEREEIQFIDNPVATSELEAYEMKASANTGRPSYSAPEGLHDDTVIARALMANAMQLRGSWMTLLG